MAIIIGDPIRVRIVVDGEPITAVYQDNKAFRDALRRFHDGRYHTEGRKVVNQSNQARLRFFDEATYDIEGVQHRTPEGLVEPLTRHVNGWQDLVYEDWKLSFAGYFEEKEATLSQEERKDLGPASDGE